MMREGEDFKHLLTKKVSKLQSKQEVEYVPQVCGSIEFVGDDKSTGGQSLGGPTKIHVCTLPAAVRPHSFLAIHATS